MLNPPSRIWSWLALVRVPNLLTVPGDVLAGAVLVSASDGLSEPALLWAVLAGLGFYMAGLVMNDLVDRATDLRERPDRPLPSGRVSPAAARGAMLALLALALMASFAGGPWMGGVGVLLGLSIIAYNLRARAYRITGALVMGACRAFNLLLGMAAAGALDTWPADRWVVPLWWGLFVAALTWLASRETAAREYGMDRWLPLAICIGGGAYLFVAAPVWNSEGNTRALMCLVFAAMLNLQSAIRLGTHPKVELPSGRTRTIDLSRIHPAAIGVMISSLIPMQAAVIVGHAETAAGLFAGFLLLIAWPLNRWLAKSFAPS